MIFPLKALLIIEENNKLKSIVNSVDLCYKSFEAEKDEKKKAS
jgi:hypothetical protein